MEIGRPGLQKGRSNWRSVQETIVAMGISYLEFAVVQPAVFRLIATGP
jgi:hypothetical protein